MVNSKTESLHEEQSLFELWEVTYLGIMFA